MPKPLTVRAPTIVLGDHAWDQYLTRCKFKNPPKRTNVHARLKDRLQARLMGPGVRAWDLRVEVWIDGLKAVMELGITGAWVVITFFEGYMELHERAERSG